IIMDTKLLKTQDGINLLKENQQKRLRDEKIIDKLAELHNLFCTENFKNDELNKLYNKMTRILRNKNKDTTNNIADSETLLDISKITDEYLQNVSYEELIAQIRYVKKETQNQKIIMEKTCSERDKLLKTIGNFIHNDVVISNDEANNKIIKEFGTLRNEEGLLS